MMYLRTHLTIAWLVFPALAYPQTDFQQPPRVLHRAEYAIQPSIGTHCRPDFFVVDSIPCAQSPNGCLPQCNGRVCRYLPDERYHRSTREELLAALSPGIPVCIVVHGSFVGARSLFPDTIGRYKRLLTSANDRPIHFIAAHWPSDPGLLMFPAIQVNELGRRAEYNGIYVAQLINSIPPENPICMIGHSHGCRLIASAIHLLGGGTVCGFSVPDACPQRRIRVVFGAAAIDQHWLNPGQRYGCGLRRVECLLNIKNRTDLPLNLYPLGDPFWHRAIGQGGFRPCDFAQMGMQAAKIRQFEVSHLVGTGHEIARYAPHPQIRASYLPYAFFD